MEPSIEHGTPTAPIRETLRAHLAAYFQEEARIDDPTRELWALLAGGEGSEIRDCSCETVHGPKFAAVGPHTDPDFPRYFTLFVVDGPGSTRLQAWDQDDVGAVYDETREKLRRKPDQDIALKPGTLIVFDAHRVHAARLPQAEQRQALKAMTQACKGQWGKQMQDTIKQLGLLTEAQGRALITSCICMKSDTRPTLQQAEALLLDHFRQQAPEAWAAAEAALAPAATTRRTARRRSP